MEYDLEINFGEFSNNTIEEIQTGEIYYSMFGEIIFYIDGINFFINSNEIPEEKMGGSSMSSEGLAIPIYGFINQFINQMDNINQNKAIRICEDQIDKEIIIEPFGENVVLSIRYFMSKYWYDGEGVKESIQIPISTYNTVPANTFKEGMCRGIREFLEKLLTRFPDLENIDEFLYLYHKVTD
ncbi:hypothetical protein [Priestia koreensis]|uniref:hypothetical protein n=1 Tax=Priestia koreensis TaxID=284581 RepID=UPI0028F72526|nr:hypothetical protein [Priestia koreensis]